MNVYLVHHADALAPHVDATRPLSARGRQQADWVATHAKQAGVKPAAIWHSGKLRARQTAEVFLVACNPFATFTMVRGLAPADPIGIMADAIELEDVDVMLVGHMPHVPELAAQLAPSSDPFPPHGLVWLERIAGRHYVERMRISPES
jgi:phosphohistidine phosphatase